MGVVCEVRQEGVRYVCGKGISLLVFVFFFNDTATTEIYTLSLHDALPISPAFYTDRQRHEFFTARMSLRQRPRFLYCPDLLAAALPLFILPTSCWGSAPAFYTDHFSLRQRFRFLYCPLLVAAAPPLFILANSRCSSAPHLYTDRQRHEFFTARISLRQRPCFLYCPSLAAAAPLLFILPISHCGSAPAFYRSEERRVGKECRSRWSPSH